MPPYMPSAFAKRVLRKLASGGVGRGCRDGSYRIGSTKVAASLVYELAKHDLVEGTPNRGLIISGAGAAFVRRNLHRSRGRGRRGDTTVAAKENDGERFRRQHQIVGIAERIIDGRRREVQLNLAESPLNWLAQRKDRAGRPFLTAEKVEAGERLRHDFTRAGMMPRMTPGYDGVPVRQGRDCGSSCLNPTEVQISARKRFLLAMESVGPELSDVLLRVCCFLEKIGEAERQLDWPARSGKVVLRIALERLAQHYKAV